MGETTAGTEPKERLRRQRATLADFGLSAFRARDLDELLREAAALVSQGLEIRFVKILEWRPETGDFLVRAGVNWAPGVVGTATLDGDGRSPAGYALGTEEPVISRDVASEDRFDVPSLLTEHGIESMLNVIIPGEHEPFGVLEVDSPERREFDEDDIVFLRNYANLLAAAVDRLRSHRTLEEALQSRSVLVRELQHRVKNILTLVQSFAMLTDVEDRTAEEYRGALVERLHALARAHAMFSEQQSSEVDINGLASRVVEPHRAEREDAVVLEGGEVTLDSRQALALGLVLHELSTNAAKYGALSTPKGQILISWRVDETAEAPLLQFLWEERGGPIAERPRRRRFGTRMIERTGSHELDGHAELIFAPEGLRYVLEFPLPHRRLD